MNPVKIVAIILLAAGTLGLMYGGFSYTKESHAVKLGSIELSLDEKQSVNVPMWLSVGAVAAGGLLLVFGGRRK